MKLDDSFDNPNLSSDLFVAETATGQARNPSLTCIPNTATTKVIADRSGLTRQPATSGAPLSRNKNSPGIWLPGLKEETGPVAQRTCRLHWSVRLGGFQMRFGTSTKVLMSSMGAAFLHTCLPYRTIDSKIGLSRSAVAGGHTSVMPGVTHAVGEPREYNLINSVKLN